MINYVTTMSFQGFYRHRYTRLKARYDMPIKTCRNLWAGLFLLILFFSSCGKRQDSDDSLAIFKYNESAGILTLDPIYAKDLPHIWACNQLYNSLVSFDDKMNLVPMVAKSWDISEDGLTYTFHLRDDVQFHEDECFTEPRFVTAADFVYSFNRVVDKQLSSPGMWIFSSVKQVNEKFAFTALNDTTLQIELSKPFPPFLGILSMTYASVVPKEAIEYYGNDFRSHPVGTGPFKFQYWKENVKLVFRKNPDYFERDEAGERLPYIDAVSISVLIDKQVAFLEFIKGKFDFMSGIDARYKDELLTYDGQLRQKYVNKIELITEPYLNTEYFSFFLDPNDSLGPNRSRALRQAVNLCIDREKMLRYLRNGLGEPGTGSRGFAWTQQYHWLQLRPKTCPTSGGREPFGRLSAATFHRCRLCRHREIRAKSGGTDWPTVQDGGDAACHDAQYEKQRQLAVLPFLMGGRLSRRGELPFAVHHIQFLSRWTELHALFQSRV